MHDHRTVLILEDDQEAARTLALVAESLGACWRTTTDPESFTYALGEVQPSCIVLGLSMSQDNLHIIDLLANQQCDAGIVLLGGVNPRILDAAFRLAKERGLNVIEHLAKPLFPRHLRKVLGQALASTNQGLASTNIVATPERKSEFREPKEITFRAIHQAIENNEFTLTYQPQMHCHDGQIAGFEALPRWRHPTQGLIGAGRFIPIVERSGLIGQFTVQIVRQALIWFSTHALHLSHRRPAHSDGALTTVPATESRPLSLSINLSTKNLLEPGFLDAVTYLCASYRVPPEQIVLELTETSAIEDSSRSLELLTRLRIKGFQVSIDDFGSGYSSMSLLTRLPFSEIKIDRRFVGTALASGESRSVIKAIIQLGRSLGLRSVAEGVEDEPTLQFLRDAGCEIAQGFRIAQPMFGEDAARWINKRKTGNLH